MLSRIEALDLGGGPLQSTVWLIAAAWMAPALLTKPGVHPSWDLGCPELHHFFIGSTAERVVERAHCAAGVR
jgi:hypothetical protein